MFTIPIEMDILNHRLSGSVQPVLSVMPPALRIKRYTLCVSKMQTTNHEVVDRLGGGHYMGRKTEILIVDDELALREAIRFVLKDRYVVATAAGGEEALKYLTDNSVNLVLLDIKMPKIDGITAFKEIRKRHPEIQVIFISAHASPEIMQDALAHGAYGFITKPFDYTKLVNTVAEALGS